MLDFTRKDPRHSPLWSIDAEQILLSIIFHDPSHVPRLQASTKLMAYHFSDHLHAAIFTAIQTLHEKGMRVTVEKVVSLIQAEKPLETLSTPKYLLLLSSQTELTTLPPQVFAEAIIHAARRREMVSIAENMIEAAKDPDTCSEGRLEAAVDEAKARLAVLLRAGGDDYANTVRLWRSGRRWADEFASRSTLDMLAYNEDLCDCDVATNMRAIYESEGEDMPLFEFEVSLVGIEFGGALTSYQFCAFREGAVSGLKERLA